MLFTQLMPEELITSCMWVTSIVRPFRKPNTVILTAVFAWELFHGKTGRPCKAVPIDGDFPEMLAGK